MAIVVLDMDLIFMLLMVSKTGEETDFAVLRETKMSAVLLENLFLDSKKDTQYLKQHSFIQGLSVTIAEDIKKVLR